MTLDSHRMTPYTLKKRAGRLHAILAPMVELILERRLAALVAEAADGRMDTPRPAAPTHTPGYEAAVQRGIEFKERVLAGDEMLSASDFARRKGVTQKALGAMRQEGLLSALGKRGQLRYPSWQLEPNVAASLPALLKILGKLDPWAQYLFLMQREPALDGAIPLELLRRGDSTHLFRVAAAYADGF